MKFNCINEKIDMLVIHFTPNANYKIRLFEFVSDAYRLYQNEGYLLLPPLSFSCYFAYHFLNDKK